MFENLKYKLLPFIYKIKLCAYSLLDKICSTQLTPQMNNADSWSKNYDSLCLPQFYLEL